MKEHFSQPTKNSNIESQNKGEKYSIIFSYDGEDCKMFITIYRPTKKLPKIQTILIQAEQTKQSFNLTFVDNVFPKLYKEVKRKMENQGRPNLRNLEKKSYTERDIEAEEDKEEENEGDDTQRLDKTRGKVVKNRNSIVQINCRYCKYATTKRGFMTLHMKKSILLVLHMCVTFVTFPSKVTWN